MISTKCLNVIFLLFLLWQTYSCNNENQLDSYLKFRYQNVKIKLAESFKKYYKKLQDVQTDIVVHNTQTFFLSSIPVSFNMLNNTYILMHDQIFTLSITQGAYVFNPHSVLTEVKGKISFIKTKEFEEIIVAVVAFTNGHTNIYTYENNYWNFIQNLPKVERIMDICLFVQDQNLYLFIINHAKYSVTMSILYKWWKGQFEESDNILTNKATSVSCFKNNNSQIIIITQNPEHHVNMIGTYVLEMTKGKLRKRHFLDSFGASKVLSYVLNGERYIIVLKNKIESTIYWWDADHFMKWKYLKEPISYQQVSIFYIRNIPILFAAMEDALVVYDLQSENINIISKIVYRRYYWKVLAMDYTLLHNQIVIYIVGLDEENYVQMLFILLSFETNQINDNSIFDEDLLLKCLTSLHEKLHFRSNLLSHVKSKSQKLLQKNKDEIYKGIISSYENVHIKNNTIHNVYSYTDYKRYLPVKDKLKYLKKQIYDINQEVEKFTGKITIIGNLYVEKLKVPSLQVNKINNNIWNPGSWFLKSKPQDIDVYVSARSVFAKQITTNNENSHLNDILLFQGNQILSGTFNLKNIIAENVFVTRINQVSFAKMCKGNSVIPIKGKKYLQNISVENIQAVTLNQKTTESILHHLQNSVYFNFYYIRNLNIQNFNFDIINDVYWRDFSFSLFKTNKNNKIEGTVIIHSDMKIRNLITKRLSNIKVDEIMTTSTDQIISSNMQLMNIDVENIQTSNVNGISFKKQAVTFYENNYFKGPVTIKNIHVKGNVNGKNFPVQDFKDSNHLQMYDCHVKIIGSLTLNNVSFLNSIKLFYKNKQLPCTYINDYWLKSQEQIISVEIIALEGFSVKTLNTTYINDKSFVLFSENYDKDENFIYYFKNIQVNGDVILHSSKNLQNLKKLLKQVVRKTGRYKVTGQKIFGNVLNIQNIKTVIVDNVEFKNIARVKKFNNFTGIKTFEKLIVQEYFILPENYKLKIRNLNDFSLIDLLNRTVYIDRQSYINNMVFKNNIEIASVIFEHLNGVGVIEMTSKLMYLYTRDKLENVFIRGNLDVKYLTADIANNLPVNGYLSEVVSIHDNIIIHGDITFKNKIQINNLRSNKINGINLQGISDKYLSRTQDQVITANYFIQNVKSPFINVSEINNMKTNLFIDRTTSNDIHIYSNLEFSSLSCKSANSKFFNIDLLETFFGLDRLPSYEWTHVTVLKDIHFSKAGGSFGRIISHAVNTLKNNTIGGKVSFNYVSAYQIQLLQSKINGVNIRKIYDDALKNEAKNQIITGKNKFTRLSATRMKIVGNTNIKNINGVDILQLNNTIVDKNFLDNFVIHGQKKFINDVHITNLKVPSTLHGVESKYLVEMHKNYSIAPNIRFKNIKIIENCNFEFIKLVNVTELLTQILKRNSNTPQYVSSTIYFKHLVFDGNVTTNHINNFNVNNVVVDHGKQFIHNSKKFYNLVSIHNDFDVELINGYRLSSIYNNAFFTETDVELDSNVIFKNPVVIYNTIYCSKVNGIDILKLKLVANDDRINVTVDAIHELKDIIDYYSKFILDNTYD